MPTASITVTITTPSDVTIQQFQDRVCAYWGYQPTLPDGSPNPESKNAFCKRMTAKFIGDSYTAACAVEKGTAGRDQGIQEGQEVTVE